MATMYGKMEEDEKRESDIFKRILHKFKLANVTATGIVLKCERVDKNKDGFIHMDDLEEIIQDMLGPNRLTIREVIFLQNNLTHERRKGAVNYENLPSFFEIDHDRRGEERWKDIDAQIPQSTIQMPTGSIGEFLQHAACPSEIKNFTKFIHILEQYEKKTGLKAVANADGFVLPLGPDLRVNIEFFLA